MEKKLSVISLGGNAILKGDQAGTIDEQEQNTSETLENLVFLISEGYDLVKNPAPGNKYPILLNEQKFLFLPC